MPGASNLVKNLDCTNCAKPLVKDGKVKCPRCKQDIELPASLSDLPMGKWRCPECHAHGFESRHVLAVDRKIKCRWCKNDENHLVEKEQKVTRKSAKKKNTGLSCKEAQLVLKVMPFRENIREMNEEAKSVRKHYAQCDGVCIERGLGRITERNIYCREALEIWASKPGPLYLCIDVETLEEMLAVEHLWGRSCKGFNAYFGTKFHDPHYEACEENPCRALQYYWQHAPLSSHYDGERETAGEIPFLIKVFIDNGWPIDKLLEIQRQRLEMFISAFVEKTRMGLTLEVGGERMPVDHMGQEINVHIKELHVLVRRLSAQEQEKE